MKGYVHIYTGNGKGKTTAAFGLALRASGADKKVFIAQFIKGKTYSEIKAVQNYLPQTEVKQYGNGYFIKKKPNDSDIETALQGLYEINEMVKSERYDLIILDEIFIALHYKLISVEAVRQLITTKPANLELVLTGRYAPDEIIELADLVTEMKEVKHYYKKDVPARKGIEF
ncbi:cob(I)yrinic acid a,c-diamide adenosyltransferase [Draconibacterium sediminis]|uniref:corrinoid adenosyltransferase n=1 Tax=Draconibacterium sediminis TaxID=1544798 RepID=A0A0D8J8F3_9BACT|nr:cob(I)yrinic acid a,c-diamide adenosyltransferase [Draconibacterium sediminis]KJF43245.1 cobinamide adenolsyltransferase [Draconibacterium sediminis]